MSRFTIDPVHLKVNLYQQELVQDIWRDKYRWGNEATPEASHRRVVRHVYKDDDSDHEEDALEAMEKGLWVPGGRILAGAGTSKGVTYFNCFVCRTIEDSVEGIVEALQDAVVTMHRSSGIGMDFSSLRPSGALLQKTGAKASGPLPFMEMWNSACAALMQAGNRRGAMIGVLADWHPDLLDFIKAKHMSGKFQNFNLSILVSDALMDAVANNELWSLYHRVPLAEEPSEPLGRFTDDNGMVQYIYQVIPARELMDLITHSTFDYSEPGVIFIDRVNDLNNLRYCEEIHCTNPCGEQPLPDNGACNLGAVNLARMVMKPFEAEAYLDRGLLRKVVSTGVRFLDNVYDVTQFPLAAQEVEGRSKRRIGLGVLGLADCLAQLKLRYGSTESEAFIRRVMHEIATVAYLTSSDLAKVRGSFPEYVESEFLQASFVSKLPPNVRQSIKKWGIRNGVLLTVAPTGTTAIYVGNVSSGVEPPFAHVMSRRVLQADGEFKKYTAEGYGYLLWTSLYPNIAPPEYLITADDLTVEDHIRVQAACQEWIDASVSKTINCPEDMGFEDFKRVYIEAYNSGCKGCTTYRPSKAREAILSKATAGKAVGPEYHQLPKRPDVLSGPTYKVAWPSMPTALYVTINEYEGRPFEIFINSRSAKNAEWITALTLMISAHMRLGRDLDFVVEELERIVSSEDSAWQGGKFFCSLVAKIGYVLRCHLAGEGSKFTTMNVNSSPDKSVATRETCPSCGIPGLSFSEGCVKCIQCGYNNCEPTLAWEPKA